MIGTRHGTQKTMRGRWFGAGVLLVGVAMYAGVAGTGDPVGAQTAGTIRTAPITDAGTIQRTGNVYISPGVTAAATYVIVAPGGLLLGPDGTPVANVTPVTYVNGMIVSGTSGPAPVQNISTPTAVPDTLAGATPGNTGGVISPGQHLVGSVDGPTNGGVPGLPPPVMSGQWVPVAGPVQTISTPTAVTGNAPAPFSATGVSATPPFSMTISTPTAVTGNAPAPFSATGASATPPFVMTISTPTAVVAPASFAGAAGYAGGNNMSDLVGTPGSTNAVSGITYPNRGTP